MPASEDRDKPLKVLWLSNPASECARTLKEALAGQVELVPVSTMPECLRLLPAPGRPSPTAESQYQTASSPSEQSGGSSFDAFLCDWCYQGGTWRSALETIRRQAPQLPVIVVCRTGGEQEWIEVLQAGAFDMICAPFSSEAVLSVLEHAAASCAEHYACAAARQCA